VREWHELLRRAQLTRASTSGGLRVELQKQHWVREELERLVAAERVCCPVLGLQVEQTASCLVLTVDAPPDAASLFEELFSSEPQD
jgi:hypothetical protein